jgi:hypothetical protein
MSADGAARTPRSAGKPRMGGDGPAPRRTAAASADGAAPAGKRAASADGAAPAGTAAASTDGAAPAGKRAASADGARRASPGAAKPATTRAPLGARVEILKLAHLLGCPPERLSYLDDVPADDLRTLRQQVTDMLFTASDSTLRRLAAASRLLPVGVVALMGERAFGPVLSARIAGLLDPGRAAEVASRLPTEFVTDIAIELDPRRARDVIARIPPERVAAVTEELIRREEWVTMGRLVGYLSRDSLQAAVGAMNDDDLLRAAFLMEDKERLDELADVLGDQRLEGLIDAARTAGLWPEVLELLRHLGERRRGKLVALAAARGEEILGPLLQAAEEQGLWDEVSMLVALLDADARERLRTALRSMLERMHGDAREHLRQRLDA